MTRPLFALFRESCQDFRKSDAWVPHRRETGESTENTDFFEHEYVVQ